MEFLQKMENESNLLVLLVVTEWMAAITGDWVGIFHRGEKFGKPFSRAETDALSALENGFPNFSPRP